jgi:hypothetical protein
MSIFLLGRDSIISVLYGLIFSMDMYVLFFHVIQKHEMLISFLRAGDYFTLSFSFLIGKNKMLFKSCTVGFLLLSVFSYKKNLQGEKRKLI